MKASYYPFRNCWRIIMPAKLSANGKERAKYFKTKEEAEEAIQFLSSQSIVLEKQHNVLEKLQGEYKLEAIFQAISELNNAERWNLMRRLRRANARERREKSRLNGLPINPKDQAESTVRYRANGQFRMRVCLQNRLYELVKSANGPEPKSSKRMCELIGCELPWLIASLKANFKPGMTWDNYGPVWHIDHKRPCANFDFADPEQRKLCFHWTNLQPLFAIENLSKGKTEPTSLALSLPA